MKLSAKLLAHLLLGTSAGCLFSSILAQPSLSLPATQTTDPLQDFRYQRSSNPFSQAGQGDNFAVMDLLRNAIKSSKNNSDGFSNPEEGLDAATAQFRARQQRLIQQPSVPANSISPR